MPHSSKPMPISSPKAYTLYTENTHACTHARANTHTHTRTHARARTHAHARTHTHAHARTHAHTHTYTRTHARTHTERPFRGSLDCPQVNGTLSTLTKRCLRPLLGDDVGLFVRRCRADMLGTMASDCSSRAFISSRYCQLDLLAGSHATYSVV